MEASSLARGDGTTQTCTASNALTMTPGDGIVFVGGGPQSTDEFSQSYISEILYFQTVLTGCVKKNGGIMWSWGLFPTKSQS